MGGVWHLKVGIALQPGVLQSHVHGVIPEGFIVSAHINDTWQHPTWMETCCCAVQVQLACDAHMHISLFTRSALIRSL